MTPELQIKPAGKMWRVYHGNTVLAFASSYSLAMVRHEELRASGEAERVAKRRAAR